jgi:putative ABC transport system permease protein
VTTPWRKAARDLWRERTRTALVVLAIAIGIAAFSTVLSSYAVLLRALDEGYLATNPASAVLRTDRVDDALLREVLSGHGIGSAEARRVLSLRLKTGPVDWKTMRLFVVKDYADIRISRLVPQAGAWPPGKGEILVERDALQVAKARIGDDVSVQASDGQERTLRVSGSAHDVGQAQARMENIVYAYATLDTLALLGEEPYLDQLTVVVAENKFDEAHVRRVAADLEKWMTSQGHPVRRLDVPTPGKHPHADIMGLLLAAMAGFGLFALVLSGVLVVNLLTALMASQARQIGVMKAVGGTRRQIALPYLGQAACLGSAAFLLAVPAGIWGSRALCRWLAVFLNFDITSFAVPAWVYLLDATVGILVPLLAAAWPIARGTAVSVREALADFGAATSAFGASALDRALATRGGLGRPLLLAIRNGFRRRARMLMTVGTLATAGVFFMSALNFRASLIRTLDRLFATRKFDLSVGLASMVPFSTVETAIRDAPGVRHVEGWITTEAALAGASQPPSAGGGPHGAGAAGPHSGGPASDRFGVVALPADTRLLAPEIVEGRFLKDGDADALVMNTALATRAPEMKVGGTVTLRMGPASVTWTVVGKVHEPFSPATAYVPRRFFDGKGGHAGMANGIRLALDKNDPASIAAARVALDGALEQAGVKAAGSAAKADGRYAFDQHMLMIYVFLLVMAAILAGVGGLGLATTMSLNVLERRREMGVLRAIGARPRTVLLIVVAEACATSLLAGALAGVVAWPVSRAVGHALVTLMFRSGVAFSFEPAGLLIWLLISLVLGAAASSLPAWHAARRPIREAIAYE